MKYLDKSINMAMFDSPTYIEGISMACNPYSSFSVAKVIRNWLFFIIIVS